MVFKEKTMKSLLISAIIVLGLCSTGYSQQVVVPVTTYVPQTVVAPVYNTIYLPVTTYYYYNPVVAAPLYVAPPYANYIVQERRGVFGCQRTYVSVIPNYPVWTYGYQNIRGY
jgi:hypothetical protein